MRPVAVLGNSRCGLRVLGLACTILVLAGCAGLWVGEMQTNLALVLADPLLIAPQHAHTKFQHGRQVRGVNRFEPWCELETARVSEQPQEIEPGRFPVQRISQAFIKDYHSRISPLLYGFGCDDLVFQETTLWMDRRTSAQVLYLRCFAPYTDCLLGPPLSLQQIQAVVGPKPWLESGVEERKLESGVEEGKLESGVEQRK